MACRAELCEGPFAKREEEISPIPDLMLDINESFDILMKLIQCNYPRDKGLRETKNMLSIMGKILEEAGKKLYDIGGDIEEKPGDAIADAADVFLDYAIQAKQPVYDMQDATETYSNLVRDVLKSTKNVHRILKNKKDEGQKEVREILEKMLTQMKKVIDDSHEKTKISEAQDK